MLTTPPLRNHNPHTPNTGEKHSCAPWAASSVFCGPTQPIRTAQISDKLLQQLNVHASVARALQDGRVLTLKLSAVFLACCCRPFASAPIHTTIMKSYTFAAAAVLLLACSAAGEWILEMIVQHILLLVPCQPPICCL